MQCQCLLYFIFHPTDTRLQTDLKEINNTITGLNTSIAEYDKNIKDEEERMAKDTQAKREAFMRKMEVAKANVATQEALVNDLTSRKQAATQRARAAEEEGKGKGTELDKLRQDIANVENTIRELQRSENSKYAAYGKGVPQAVAEIQRTRWHGDVPLGPLGIHVKVRDPNAWADLLASQLSGSLTAFALTDGRDREALKKIFDRCGV